MKSIKLCFIAVLLLLCPLAYAQQNVPEYLKNRISMQQRYLGDINSKFGAQVLAQVPELERDVTGLPAIERLARIMYA